MHRGVGMLKDILEKKKCFKLVCGAGNEDADEVEKLVYLYSMAGCNFFDLCAKPEIVAAAKNGLKRAGIFNDRYLCVSVGIKGDPHVSKADINPDKCKLCSLCNDICLQNAIFHDGNGYTVNSKRCIGCARCLKVCKNDAIAITSEYKNLNEVLPPIVEMGIDCIELHALGENELEVDEKWADINNFFNGMLSICIDRSKLGNEALLKRVNRMLSCRKPYSTIIQADGAPMSGADDDFKTTLQTVATAEIFQNANLPVYILLSGGTNSKSTELAKICGINPNGVAIGSYARKIVRSYIMKEDFFDNKNSISAALKLAQDLVNKSLEHMG